MVTEAARMHETKSLTPCCISAGKVYGKIANKKGFM